MALPHSLSFIFLHTVDIKIFLENGAMNYIIEDGIDFWSELEKDDDEELTRKV